MLEESNAFTMVFLDLSSLQTNVYTRLRITDWNGTTLSAYVKIIMQIISQMVSWIFNSPCIITSPFRYTLGRWAPFSVLDIHMLAYVQ